MKRLRVFFSFMFAGLIAGCGKSDPPITIELVQNAGISTMQNINITSKVDDISIKKVIANRGNCAVNLRDGANSELKFGQSTVAYLACNDPAEVEVDTDAGNFTFTF